MRTRRDLRDDPNSRKTDGQDSDWRDESSRDTRERPIQSHSQIVRQSHSRLSRARGAGSPAGAEEGFASGGGRAYRHRRPGVRASNHLAPPPHRL
eukprot:6055732-Pyramimonas_sp.AAC.1